MYNFNYHKPSSIDDAMKLHADAEDGVYLAGGHTLIPSMKQRLAAPTDLIDLSGIDEMTGLDGKGAELVVGALTRHEEVAASPLVARDIPALGQLAVGIGDAQVRNCGTLGGSIANNDPAADYPAALLGLGAEVQTSKRSIAADEFFTGMFETALEPGEILTSVRFPKPSAAAYAKFPNPASRYAVVGVFVARFEKDVRVAITGAAPAVFRSKEMEAALAANFAADALADIKLDASGMNEDLHASAEYRAHLCTVMARRALASING